jgi:HAD superfamily hydrolase (TIGR01509 family)
MDFKAVIFDSEGVIINTEPLWDKAQEILLSKRNIKYNRAEIKHLIAGLSQRDGARTLLEKYNLRENLDDFIQERRTLMYELIEKDLELIYGFEDFIVELKKSGYKVAIATSMAWPMIEKVKNKLPLEKYFGKYIYSVDDVNGRGKPAPDLFLYVAKMLNVNSDDCLVIEDSPLGIEAARNSGMFCIAITTTFSRDILNEKQPDLLVDSFEQIQFTKLNKKQGHLIGE